MKTLYMTTAALSLFLLAAVSHAQLMDKKTLSLAAAKYSGCSCFGDSGRSHVTQETV